MMAGMQDDEKHEFAAAFKEEFHSTLTTLPEGRHGDALRFAKFWTTGEDERGAGAEAQRDHYEAMVDKATGVDVIQALILPVVLLIIIVLAWALVKGERQQKWDTDAEMESRRKCKAELADIARKRPELICRSLEVERRRGGVMTTVESQLDRERLRVSARGAVHAGRAPRSRRHHERGRGHSRARARAGRAVPPSRQHRRRAAEAGGVMIASMT